MTVEQLLGGQSMAHWPLDPTLAAAQAPTEKAMAAVDPGERPSLEFKVGRLAMGFEEHDDLFVLLAHDQETDPDGPATLALRSVAQAASLAVAADHGDLCVGPAALPPLRRAAGPRQASLSPAELGWALTRRLLILPRMPRLVSTRPRRAVPWRGCSAG